MSKRTTGPWEIGRRYGLNKTEIVANTGHRAVATVWTHVHTADRKEIALEEGVANARLIAAAPELLEACKATLAPDGMSVHATTRVIEMLRAAIAKAEGDIR